MISPSNAKAKPNVILESLILAFTAGCVWLIGLVSTKKLLLELGVPNPMLISILLQAVFSFFQVYVGRYVKGEVSLPSKVKDIGILVFGFTLVLFDIFANLGGVYQYVIAIDDTVAYKAIPFFTSGVSNVVAFFFSGFFATVFAIYPEWVVTKIKEVKL